jgi:hypothetical protein
VYVDDPTGKDMSQVATWLIVPINWSDDKSIII